MTSGCYNKSVEHRKKISIKLSAYQKSIGHSPRQKTGNRVGRPYGKTGYRLSLSHRRKISEALMGENAPNWQGGKVAEKAKIRDSLEYRIWRETVYKRDNYTCTKCKIVGKRLNAHHIKPFSLFPELRLTVENGITLCETCHKKTHEIRKSIKRIEPLLLRLIR